MFPWGEVQCAMLRAFCYGMQQLFVIFHPAASSRSGVVQSRRLRSLSGAQVLATAVNLLLSLPVKPLALPYTFVL